MLKYLLSVTVIKNISADSKAIPSLVIVPSRNIMVSWFSENMTGAEVVTVSPSGYTNEGDLYAMVRPFIQHNDCRPNKPWMILLLDGAMCYEADDFIIKAKMNHIWIVKFLPHQTNLPSLTSLPASIYPPSPSS